MEEKIEFDISLRAMDMYHFLLRHAYTGFSGLFGLFLSLLALVGLFSGVAGDDKTKLVLLVLAASLFTVINPLHLFFRAKKQVTLSPAFKEPLHYLFNEEAITVAQGEEEISIPWEDVRKAVSTPRILVIYMTHIHAYILPKELCGGDYEKLRTMIRRKMGKRAKI